jgi:glycosyltransferase involved in cell wall biosynthesis
MGNLKICVYAISKNEEQFVQRFIESSKDADLILIADTGSTDETATLARSLGATVPEICVTPWRFDLARNAALALIPKDIDVCISLDLDEILQEGWREEIERVWIKGETTRLSYFFDWGCGIQFRYEKIHARHGYRWHHPCHEYPVPDGRISEVWASTDMLLAVHKPDPTKSRGQYLDLLRVSVEEDPNCPRNGFYYARELSFHRMWQQAIDECNRYLNLPRATWENERCYAYRVMGRCYSELGNAREAERAFQMASFEAPNTREPWCELATLYYRQSRWSECFAMATRALQVKDRMLVYTVDPEVWGAQPYDLAAISAWHLGLKDLAIEYGEKAAELAPDDGRIIDNLKWYKGEKTAGVPNIIHFIYFGGEGSRPFSYLNYLAVRAALDIQKPEAIFIYYDQEPTDNPHWDRAKKYATAIKVDAPQEYKGVKLQYPHYKSDIFRLTQIEALGGIYLDNDLLLTKPLTPFMQENLVMGADNNDPETKSIANAVIIAKPKSKFLNIWLDQLSQRITDKWAEHAVVLPAELAKEHPDLIWVESYKSFIPFHWDNKAIFEKNNIDDIIAESYGVHMWETFWGETLALLNDDYMSSTNNAFTKLFGKYAGP